MSYKDSFRSLYKNLSLSLHEIDSEIDFATDILFNLSPKDFLLGKSLSKEQENILRKIISERVETDRPLQQILGQAYFAGDKFFVSKDTLIPRPETEFIIEVCKNNFDKNQDLKILDIGTGSGCIAIELAKSFPQAMVDGVDISPAALEIAQKNAKFHNLSGRVKFFSSDVFSNVTGAFDTIVSNPPYIPFEADNVQKNVSDYEPHSALFAEDNGLFFYKKIISELSKYLKDDALVVFECGIGQAEFISDIFSENGFVNIRFTEDYNGINRVVSANFKR